MRRRVSGTGRTLPEDSIQKITSYLNQVQDIAENFERHAIFNFDESSFYMDMPGNYCLERKGYIVLQYLNEKNFFPGVFF